MYGSSLSQRIRGVVILLTCSFLAAGCGDDDNPSGPGGGGGGNGSVQAVVTDGGSSNAVVSGDRQAATLTSAAFSGSMEADAHVEIHSQSRGWVQLGSPSRINMQMQSGSEATVSSSTQVEADTYDRVRLVMENSSATILSGSVIGTLTLTGDVTIQVGGSDGQVTVEKSVSSFTVTANSNSKLVFDLNSETWVNSQSVDSQTAADASIQSATTVTVQ